MNRSDFLTDELILAVFERRAEQAAAGDLRETILTLSAASSQRSPWRRPLTSTISTSAFFKGLVAATLVGAVGVALLVMRSGQPSVAGPSATPGVTASPSTPASPSVGPSVAVVPPRAPGWVATGDMTIPVFGHKATLLPDGRVLVVEDFVDPTGRVMRAELYDPGTGTWAATGSMVAPRSSYSATSLADGKVLVAGGADNSGALASAEIYDPVSGTWSATGAMSTARYYHTATLLLDGKVLVAGGIVAGDSADDQVPFAELYDPVSGTWTATGAMATDRAYHTATLLTDGRVLVAGGAQDGVRGGPVAELYDPISGTWTAAGNMITPTPRSGHTATLLPDGKVLVVGGVHSIEHSIEPVASAELYDPESGTWSATQGLVEPRSGHSATLLPNGSVLVAGGMTSESTSGSGGHELLASAELYDSASGTWSATASMVDAREAHTATLLPDGSVLVAGGNGFRSPPGGVVLASAELYNPGSGN